MKKIGRQGDIYWRGKWEELGGNGKKVQSVSFRGGLGSFEHKYRIIISNGKSGHGLNLINHRRLRGKLR